MEHIEEIKQTK